MPATPEIFARHPNPVLVETGTYHGEGIEAALAAGFSDVRSVELSPQLHQAAAAHFADDGRVRLWLGHSAERLPEMLAGVVTPATFWLDAHYSGGGTAGGAADCPLLGELAAIAAHPIRTHTILIDDVRQFGHEMPVTIDQARAALLAINPDYAIALEQSGNPELGLDILVARLA
jgi:hypothetical protein